MSSHDDGCMSGSAAKASDDAQGEQRSIDEDHSSSQYMLTLRDDSKHEQEEQP
jgi:hypothetical protein